MNTDSCGHAWWHWVIGGLVIVVAATLTVITAGGFNAILGAIGIGNATGLSGFFASVFVGAGISSLIGAVGGGLTSLINKENIIDGIGKGFMWGSILGAISGGLGFFNFKGKGNIPKIGKPVGNIYQIFGQSIISGGFYNLRASIENEQTSFFGGLLALANGIVGGILSNVAFLTQLTISLLFEIENIAIEYAKQAFRELKESFIKLI